MTDPNNSSNSMRMKWRREMEKYTATELVGQLPPRYVEKHRKREAISQSTKVMMAARDFIEDEMAKSGEMVRTAVREYMEKEMAREAEQNEKCGECKGSGRVGGIGFPPGLIPTDDPQVCEMQRLARRLIFIAAQKTIESGRGPPADLKIVFEKINNLFMDLGDGLADLDKSKEVDELEMSEV